jgi:hypothetical protein
MAKVTYGSPSYMTSSPSHPYTALHSVYPAPLVSLGASKMSLCTTDKCLAVGQLPELVASKVQEHGHLMPAQASGCAGRWGTRQLVLNHISTW